METVLTSATRANLVQAFLGNGGGGLPNWFMTGTGDPYTSQINPTVSGALYYDTNGSGLYFSYGNDYNSWSAISANAINDIGPILNGNIIGISYLGNDLVISSTNGTISIGANNIKVSGTIGFNNDVTVNGNTNLTNTNISGKLTVTSGLTVSGSLSVASEVDTGSLTTKTLTVNSGSTLYGGLSVTSGSTTVGNITITGTSNFQNGIYTGSLTNTNLLQVVSSSSFFGSMNLNGQTIYNVGSITASGITNNGSLSTIGETDTGALTVTSGITINSTVSGQGSTSLYAPNGGATFGGNLTVGNNATISGNLTVSGTIASINPMAYGNPNVGESFSRYIATVPNTVSSATMRFAGVYLTAGQVVKNIVFATSSATTSSGLTSAWGGIFTTSGTTTTMYLLAATSGQVNPTYAATSVITTALSGTFTVPSNGIYLVGFVFFGTTPPGWAGTGNAANGILGAQYPVIMAQTSMASYSTPPAIGTSFAIGGSSYAPWFALT